MKIYKRCACGRECTLAGWLHLPCVGRDIEAKLKLRNCVCGSTLALAYTGAGEVVPDEEVK